MGLGISRAFGEAVKGTLKGVYEGGVVPEERKRETYTTAALNANVKKALKLEDERIKASKEAREEIEQIKALEGMTNSSGKILTEAERTAVVKQAKAMGIKVDEIIDEFEIVSSKDAKIVPGKPVIYKVGQVADFEDREDAGFFATGRNKQISEDVAKLLKASGVDTEVQIPTPNTVEGVKLTRKQKDNAYEGFEYGSYTITENGETKVVQGILNPELNPEKGRLYLDTTDNKYKPVPADSKWNGTTARTTITKTDSEQSEVDMDFAKNVVKLDSRLGVKSHEFREALASGNVVMEGLERMSLIALDDRNYSSLMSMFGNVAKGIQNEVAGISFVFANGDNISEKDAYEADTLNIRNQDGKVNVDRAKTVLDTLTATAQELENDLTSRAIDISSNRRLMEIQALRLAIAEIVVDGDARPSDFDVQSRMKGYLGRGSKEFMKLAEEVIAKTQSSLSNRREALSGSPSLEFSRQITTRATTDDKTKSAAELFINSYAPSLEKELKLPSFTQQGFDKSQFVKPTMIDQPIIELHTKEDGTKVKRVIMPDGGYLQDGGKVLEAPETMSDEAMMKVASELLKKEQK